MTIYESQSVILLLGSQFTIWQICINAYPRRVLFFIGTSQLAEDNFEVYTFSLSTETTFCARSKESSKKLYRRGSVVFSRGRKARQIVVVFLSRPKLDLLSLSPFPLCHNFSVSHPRFTEYFFFSFLCGLESLKLESWLLPLLFLQLFLFSSVPSPATHLLLLRFSRQNQERTKVVVDWWIVKKLSSVVMPVFSSSVTRFLTTRVKHAFLYSFTRFYSLFGNAERSCSRRG